MSGETKEGNKEDTADIQTKAKSSKLITLIMAGILVLLLAVVGIMAMLLLKKSDLSTNTQAENAMQEYVASSNIADAPKVDANKSSGNKIANSDKKKYSKKASKSSEKAKYYPIRPVFVLNFDDNKGKSRFVQISVDVVSRDSETIQDIQSHLPRIQHELVDLFTAKKFSEIYDPKNRKNLRGEALDRIQSLLYNETGSAEVEAVLFTNFVIQ